MPRKLRVEFRSEDSFRREYAENIARGGIFIPTRLQLDLRESVEIELVLAFQDQSVVLPGEVVHCVPPEMAETGAQPGVAIQFLIDGEQVRSKLGMFAGQAGSLDERSQGTGRRVAARYRARVPAEVQIDGVWIAGHTRNLSTSGALIALPGDPPPVGRKVAIRIDHPSGDQPLEIGGVAARHVESAGSVCVGIQFRVPEAREAEIADFIGRLHVLEHSRRLGGINGPIADLGIRSILAMFGSCAPEGMLTLTRGDEEGYITIDHGNLRAQVGSRIGREALDFLMSWTSGSFEFEGQPDQGLVDGETIALSEIVPDAPVPQASRSDETLDELALGDESEDPLELGDESEDELILTELEVLDPGGESQAPTGEEEGGLVLDHKADSLEESVIDDQEADSLEEFVIDDQEGDSLEESVIDDHEARLAVDAAPISADAILVLVPDGERWELSKIEEALLDLAAVAMTVAKAVEIIPEPDNEIYAALQSLLAEDLLTLE